MKRLAAWLAATSVASFVFVMAAVTPAAAATSPLTTVACNAGSILGFPTWDSCLRQKYGELKLGELNDIWLVVLPIVETILRAGGYIAVGFIIWGSIQYIKSQGDSGKTTSARSTILNAIIGLVICILSVVLVQFVAGTF